jgi:hypothetical protein
VPPAQGTQELESASPREAKEEAKRAMLLVGRNTARSGRFASLHKDARLMVNRLSDHDGCDGAAWLSPYILDKAK